MATAWGRRRGERTSVITLCLVVACALLGSIGVSAAHPLPAHAASVPRIPDGPNSWVGSSDTDQTTGVTYVGGGFTRWGPQTGGGAGLNASTGAIDRQMPQVSGEIAQVAADGGGGWFVAGSFTAIGGVPRNRLAHILADGTVDTAWTPQVEGEVSSLQVSGPLVYLGGSFSAVNGEKRSRLAAVTRDGAVTPWNPDVQGSGVWDLVVAGATVYVGGSFDSVGGEPRKNLAAVTVDGALTGWAPDTDASVLALAVAGSTVYLGGTFGQVKGVPRNYLAAVTDEDFLTDWNPNAQNMVFDLAVLGSNIYVAGWFSKVAGQQRSHLAAISTAGALTAWNPGTDTVAFTLAVSGSTVYAGGWFTRAGGQPRNHIAAFDTNGTVTPWAPDIDSAVDAVAATGTAVYAGGRFKMVGGVPRMHVAALGPDGKLAAWNPGVDSGSGRIERVDVVKVSGSLVYIGGTFEAVGGEGRMHLAAVTTTGAVTPWNPNVGGQLGDYVSSLAISGSTVYFAGDFTTIGGQPRNRLAAATTSGVLTPWNPNQGNPDTGNRIGALAASGSTVYVGGSFRSIGTVPRSNVAAVDSSGTVTGWNPGADSSVATIAVAGGLVYLGGYFTSVGPVSRRMLAAVTTEGVVTSWSPAVSSGFNNYVHTIRVVDSLVYVGGRFTEVDQQPRPNVAAITSEGILAAWNPGTQKPALTIAPTRAGVYVGGDFTSSPSPLLESGSATAYLARFRDPGALPGAPTVTNVVPQDRQASISFTPPDHAGDAPITNYEYTIDGGSVWTPRSPDSTTSPAIITGLTNGTPYVVGVRAVNEFGPGLPSDTTWVIPRTIPGAPEGVVATPGDGQVTFTFTPGDSGGAPISNYEYSTDAGAIWTAMQPPRISSPVVITGLTNGVTYTFRLRAVNAAGPGAASRPLTVTPTLPPSIMPITPVRVADTRQGMSPDYPWPKAPLEAGRTLVLPLAGAHGIPADAGAVSLNVTVVLPESAGFITVYPCGEPAPNASNVNYVRHQIVADAVVSEIGANGGVCVFTSARTEVAVDLNGWMPRRGGFTGLAPARAADTRPGQPVAFPTAKQPLPAGGTLAVPIAGQYGVPGTAGSVSLNVTAVTPRGGGYLTVYPCGSPQPLASSVNYISGQVVPNAVVTGVGDNGRVCVFTSAQADVVVDVNGWFAPAPQYTPVDPVRIADTRPGQPVAFPSTKTPLPPRTTLRVPVAGVNGVPPDAGGVVLNVTAVPSPLMYPGIAFVSVSPCGSFSWPSTSTINYFPGLVVANMAQTGIGDNGEVCITSSDWVDIVVDLDGWYPKPPAPSREQT